MTPQNPPTHTEGLGEMVRALRLYTGLSQREMAQKMPIDRRTYQRIENGQELCPTGFIDTLRTIANEFDDQVDAVIAAAEQRLGAENGAVPIEVRAGDEFAWERAVVGRAAVESDTITPIMVGEVAAVVRA